MLADVAFLAMDLERLGRVDLAARLLDGYRSASGDDWPASLADFYIAYRAHVRAKIARIRSDNELERQLLGLVESHLRDATVRLVLVGGPPATGKTTVAASIAAAKGWAHVRSDEVRKTLAGLPPTRRAAAPAGCGIYTPSMTDRTYAALCDRARGLLRYGCSVVLDATWSDLGHRAAAAQVAKETASELVMLRCDAPDAIAVARARRRYAEGADASDADAAIAAVGAARFAPWPQAVVLDTTRTPDDVASEALAAVEST